MGYYKDLEIARMEDPLHDAPEFLVGISCFENRLIREHIISVGDVGICHYSGIREETLPLKDILRFILDIVNSYFTDPADEAGWDRDLDDDGPVPGFVKMGSGYVVPVNKLHYYSTEELLEGECLYVNNSTLYGDILQYMPEQYWVERDLYGLNDQEIKAFDWHEIMKKASDWVANGLSYRNLPVADRTRLYQLLNDFHLLDDITVKTEAIKLYRTVKYNNPLIKVNFSDLTSAPNQYAFANRMSFQGVSMFYGASSSECAQIESIGNDKSVYYVGEFKSLHLMNLLDLRRVRQRMSIFDIDSSRYHTVCFLDMFAKEISRPINGNKQHEYAPTQFLTDFIRNNFLLHLPNGQKAHLDGILYDSSKVKEEFNAVLFFDNPSSASHLKLISYEVIDKR